MTKITYKKPREVVGQYLAESYRAMGWTTELVKEYKVTEV